MSAAMSTVGVGATYLYVKLAGKLARRSRSRCRTFQLPFRTPETYRQLVSLSQLLQVLSYLVARDLSHGLAASLYRSRAR